MFLTGEAWGSLGEDPLGQGRLVRGGLHPGNSVCSIGGRPQCYDGHDEQQEHSRCSQEARQALQHSEQGISAFWKESSSVQLSSCWCGLSQKERPDEKGKRTHFSAHRAHKQQSRAARLQEWQFWLHLVSQGTCEKNERAGLLIR